MLTRQQWHECGRALARMEEAKQWWLGDWWNAGVMWGEGEKVCQELGLEYSTTTKAGRVAQHFDFCRRRQNLPVSHHLEVCVIKEPDVQDRFLLWCEEPLETTGKPRSIRDLREAVRAYLDAQGWTPFERERRRCAEDLGYPTLANHHLDPHLIQWAKFAGKHVYIGRGSKWGNPFEIGKDGDREYVIDSLRLPRQTARSSAISGVGSTTGQGAQIMTRCLPRTASHSLAERPRSKPAIGRRGIVPEASRKV
jgi:hypothetical protein